MAIGVHLFALFVCGHEVWCEQFRLVDVIDAYAKVFDRNSYFSGNTIW